MLLFSVVLPLLLIWDNYSTITFEYQDSLQLGNDVPIEGLDYAIYENDGTTLVISGTTSSSGLIVIQMVSDDYIIKYDWFGVNQELGFSTDSLIELDSPKYIGSVKWEDSLELLPIGYEVDLLLFNGISWDILYSFTIMSGGSYNIDLVLGELSINPTNDTFTITDQTIAETEPYTLYLESIQIIISIINLLVIIYSLCLNYSKLKNKIIQRLQRLQELQKRVKNILWRNINSKFYFFSFLLLLKINKNG